jgi:putrescine transport system permease protein
VAARQRRGAVVVKVFPRLGSRGAAGRGLVIGVPLFWLSLFFLAPFLIVLKVSFAEAVLGNPPFGPLLEWVDGAFVQLRLNVENYRLMFEDSLYLGAFLNSLRVAAVSTLLCLLIGYPMAYGIARTHPACRSGRPS